MGSIHFWRIARTSCRFANRLEVWGYKNKVREGGLFEPTQVGFASVAAISNRHVFLPKVDAPKIRGLVC